MIIISYPKSGRTWLARMLSNYYGYYFAEKDFSKKGLKLITQGKMGPTNWITTFHEIDLDRLNELKKIYNKKIVYLIRDPRDCLTSYYFYKIYHKQNKINMIFHWLKINTFKKKFMEDTLNSWKVHVNTYIGTADYVVKYEDLLDKSQGNCANSLCEIIENVDRSKLEKVIENFRFENITGRQHGEEDKTAFARKGIKGDWLNYFNKKGYKKLIKETLGQELVQYGYEQDLNW